MRTYTRVSEPGVFSESDLIHGAEQKDSDQPDESRAHSFGSVADRVTFL
jgi:hypothetical protein